MIKLIILCTIIGNVLFGTDVMPATDNVSKAISGTVTDSVSGKPLSGVHIMIKGVPIGTTTNDKGQYVIIATASTTLIFSKEGMKTKEIPVGDKSKIDVKLEKESKDKTPPKKTSR